MYVSSSTFRTPTQLAHTAKDRFRYCPMTDDARFRSKLLIKRADYLPIVTWYELNTLYTLVTIDI